MFARIAWLSLGHIALRLGLLTLLGVGVGVCASLATMGFLQGVSWLNRLFFAQPGIGWLAGVLAPVAGGLVVGLLVYRRKRVADADSSRAFNQPGPAQVVYAVQLREGMPPFVNGLRSSGAAFVSVACGASVGILGPLIYLGAMVGQLAEKTRLPVSNLRAGALACGVAAAIATVFGAPIAGMLFAHEVLLRNFSVQVAAPVTLAAVSSYLLSQSLLGQSIWIGAEGGSSAFGSELLLFVFFGLACACIAIFFMRSLIWSAGWLERLPVPLWLRPAVAGMLVGLVGLWLPDIASLSAGGVDLRELFSRYSGPEMALLLVVKILLTSLCLGMGFVGGVFSPSLIIGLLFGGAFWWVLETLGLSNSGFDAYALGGMMAVTSCVMGAPFATVLIVFEITRSYELTIVAMVGVAFANLLATRIFGRSYADVQLMRMGTDIRLGGEHALLHKRTIGKLVQPDGPSLRPEMRTSEAAHIMRMAGRNEAVVCDAAGVFVGVVRLIDLLEQKEQPIAGLLAENWPVLEQTTSLWSAMNAMSDFVGEMVPVVDSDGGRLLGMVSEGAVMQAYVEIVESSRELHHASL